MEFHQILLIFAVFFHFVSLRYAKGLFFAGAVANGMAYGGGESVIDAMAYDAVCKWVGKIFIF